MPFDIKGYEFIRRMKARGYSKKILVDSFSNEENIKKALRERASGAMPYPSSYEDRMKFLSNYFGKQKVLRFPEQIFFKPPISSTSYGINAADD